VIIDGLNLRELEMSQCKFTWPIFEKLHRILITTEWEEKFPLSTVRALTREISNHTPLLLNTEKPTNAHTEPMFKFELRWLLRDGFIDMIRDLWSNTTTGHTPMERWHGKIRRVRQHLRGWAKNISGQYKKEKKQILNILYTLDKKQKIPH
jgi:hypothetical protein